MVLKNQNSDLNKNQQNLPGKAVFSGSQAIVKKSALSKVMFLSLFLSLFLIAGGFFWNRQKKAPSESLKTKTATQSQPIFTFKPGIEKFKSEDEFRNYLQKAPSGLTDPFNTGLLRLNQEPASFSPAESFDQEKGWSPERVSGTNVQVKGIDEPDIVKTDGSDIYFSSTFYAYPLVRQPGLIQEEKIAGPKDQVQVINAFPPASLSLRTPISKRGDLLINDKSLVIFTDSQIYGFDISDSANPKEKWVIQFKDQNKLVSARLYQKEIYTVIKQTINPGKPCPITPMTQGQTEISLSCNEIYRPLAAVPLDAVYTIFVTDPNTGKVKDTLAFAGPADSSLIYMSPKSLYLTYFCQSGLADFYYAFLEQEGKGLIPAWIFERIAELKEYQISEQSKMVEISLALQQLYNSLDEEQRKQLENSLQQQMDAFYRKNKRELEKTGIVKINLTKLEVVAAAGVPGHLLNQFSLDEYRDNLRLAVTIGDTFIGSFGGGQSANDVYVLDKDLKVTGSIRDLGLGEQIYSARFIEDKGYLVTFRQVDPFHILDLSQPRNPQLAGELKVPGYSSYLHPIDSKYILGIGEEGSRVKISLFNVLSASNPVEEDKYLLDQFWSDILQTHHAFLIDPKYKVFFLPASNGGYVFSYRDNKLELKAEVKDIVARRAVYINDYLYIIADDRIVVLDEKSWQEIKQISF
ncbi:MAG TPA: beta-propeller domain-containing protein [Candidatus Bathyarchaeia archaeon]|nr:beta-propeller domain-containing protein [Candidatus Bathyarchaeia archaeon]